MFWNRPEYRIALALLIQERRLTRNAAIGALIDRLLEAAWVRQTSRRREVELTALGEREVHALLRQHWPDWESAVQSLQDAGFPLSGAGLAMWERERQHVKLEAGVLPAYLNQKTLAARFREHSKAGSAEGLQRHYPQVRITTDEVLRLRAPAGMTVVGGDGGRRLSSDDVMAICGEVMLPERALLEGARLEGVPRAVLTVENPGVYVDMVLPPGVLAVLVPGWNSNLALRLLELIPHGVPFMHFGDLDPEGWEILLHLRRRLNRVVAWFVPSFWADYLVLHARELPGGAAWPAMEDASVPPVVHTLARMGRWLEQEVIVLDPRLEAALLEHL